MHEDKKSKWTPVAIAAFLLYALTGVVFSIVVKKTQVGGKLPYGPVAVTLCLEMTKMLLVTCYLLSKKEHGHDVISRAKTVISHKDIFFSLAVPAICYAMYNLFCTCEL